MGDKVQACNIKIKSSLNVIGKQYDNISVMLNVPGNRRWNMGTGTMWRSDILACVMFSQSISMHVEIKLSLCFNSQNNVRVTNMKMRQL